MSNRLIFLLRPESRFAVSAFRYTTDFIQKNYDFTYAESVADMAYWWDKKIEILLIPYGFQLIRNMQSKINFIRKHSEARVIRFYNEYSLGGNVDIVNAYKDRGYEFITNFEKFGTQFDDASIRKYYQCNVNCLIYDDIEIKDKSKKYDCVYYGTFRTGRKKYFEKYFASKSLLVSVSSSKSKNRFIKNLKAKPAFIQPLQLRTSKSLLSKFRFSLYIEDEFTHKVYNYPANRYYEALKYGTLLLFDVNTENTFKKYGIDISSFTVDGVDSLNEKIKEIKSNYSKFLKMQEAWKEKAKQDKTELKEQFDNIFN